MIFPIFFHVQNPNFSSFMGPKPGVPLVSPRFCTDFNLNSFGQ
jgi:hypothetical protein